MPTVEPPVWNENKDTKDIVRSLSNSPLEPRKSLKRATQEREKLWDKFKDVLNDSKERISESPPRARKSSIYALPRSKIRLSPLGVELISKSPLRSENKLEENNLNSKREGDRSFDLLSEGNKSSSDTDARIIFKLRKEAEEDIMKEENTHEGGLRRASTMLMELHTIGKPNFVKSRVSGTTMHKFISSGSNPTHLLK